jgi:F-type H+-transporting ATPase subunit a
MPVSRMDELAMFAPDFNTAPLTVGTMQKFSINKGFRSFLLLVAATLLPLSYAAASGGGEAFNAGDMIMHHVMDAHDIHFMTIGEGEHAQHISLPLPVIIYSTDDGLSVFLSSAFHHGHAAHNGYMLDHGHIIRLGQNNPHFNSDHVDIIEAKGMGYRDQNVGGMFKGAPGAFIDLSITKTVAGLLITIALMFGIFLSVAKAYKTRQGQAPKGLQTIMEQLVLFIRDEVAKPSIGHHYEVFMPFLLTIFFFIWFANMLGLIPFIGGFNVTGNIAVAMVLAILTFIITTVKGNKNYWMHLVAPPGVPVWLLPLMIPIEIMGIFTKPLVLCLRLFANITAGHIIILSFMSLIFIFANQYGAAAGYGVSIVSLAFGIFMNVMELLVAFLQAYVFTLLSALYFGSAVEEHHH